MWCIRTRDCAPAQEKGVSADCPRKVRKLGDVGGSLMMQPNGYVYFQTLVMMLMRNRLKVLSLLGVDEIASTLEELRDQRYTGDTAFAKLLLATYI